MKLQLWLENKTKLFESPKFQEFEKGGFGTLEHAKSSHGKSLSVAV